MTNEEQLFLIGMCEQLKDVNQSLRDGIKSANVHVKASKSNVAALKRLLDPTAKTGHKKLLETFLRDAEWALMKATNERKGFREQVKNNKLLITALTSYIKNTPIN